MIEQTRFEKLREMETKLLMKQTVIGVIEGENFSNFIKITVRRLERNPHCDYPGFYLLMKTYESLAKRANELELNIEGYEKRIATVIALRQNPGLQN